MHRPFLIVFSLIAASTCHAFSVGPYQPLEAGNRWNYDQLAAGTTVSITVEAHPDFRDNSQVWALRQVFSDDTLTTFTSNDTRGLRAHGSLSDATGLRLDFSPPIRQATAEAEIADQQRSNGTVTATIFGQPSTGTYDATATLAAFETISVPAGSFETLRINTTTRLEVTLFGQQRIETVTESIWLAKGIGIVQVVRTSPAPRFQLALRSTNVMPPPADQDGDGIPDTSDNCPTVANEDQQNTDNDSAGNACDADDDNDELSDTLELSEFGTDPLDPDTDGDGIADGLEVQRNRNPRVNEAAVLLPALGLITDE